MQQTTTDALNNWTFVRFGLMACRYCGCAQGDKEVHQAACPRLAFTSQPAEIMKPYPGTTLTKDGFALLEEMNA